MNIPKLKETDFIVLYELFFEYGNFGEGDYSENFEIFQSSKKAHDFVELMETNHNCRNVVGPLKYIGKR